MDQKRWVVGGPPLNRVEHHRDNWRARFERAEGRLALALNQIPQGVAIVRLHGWPPLLPPGTAEGYGIVTPADSWPTSASR
jgi:hypothetical protein